MTERVVSLFQEVTFEKMFEITANEFMDKHHHYWNIFLKSLYFDVFLLGFLLFNESIIKIAASNFSCVTKIFVLFSVIVFLLCKAAIILREYIVLKRINERYNKLYEQIPFERLPDISYKSRWLKFFNKCNGIGLGMVGIVFLASLLNVFILACYLDIIFFEM